MQSRSKILSRLMICRRQIGIRERECWLARVYSEGGCSLHLPADLAGGCENAGGQLVWWLFLHLSFLSIPPGQTPVGHFHLLVRSFLFWSCFPVRARSDGMQWRCRKERKKARWTAGWRVRGSPEGKDGMQSNIAMQGRLEIWGLFLRAAG